MAIRFLNSQSITGNGTYTGSVITPNAIVDNVTAKTTNGNILFKNNAGTSIARFNNNVTSDFFGSVTVGSGLGAVSTDAILAINGGSGSGGEAYLRLMRGGTAGFILNHTATAIQVRATANIPMFFYTNDTISLKINANNTLSLPTYGAGYLKTDGSGNVTADSSAPGTGVFLPLAGGTLTGNLAGTTIGLTGGITANHFRTNAGNTDYNLLTRDSTGNTLFVQAAQSNTNQPIAKFSFGSATVNAGNTVLQVSKNNSHFVNCNVGIGTTNPGAKLQVGSRGTAGALTPPATDGILFDFHNDGSPYTRHAAIISQAGDATESVIDFWTKVASGTSAKKMTIRGNGNVGIGTTSPDSRLDVTGGDITVNTSSVGFMTFKYGAVGSENTMGSIQTTGIDLKINANSDLLLLPGSNVGIDTTSPLAKLQIGLSTSNNGERSTLAMFGAAASGVLNALSLVNTTGAAATGNGTRINFHLSSNYSPTGCIEVVTTDLSVSATDSTMRFKTYGTIGSSVTYVPRLEISPFGAIKFNDYNLAKQTGTPTYILGTDGSGNVVKVLGGGIPGGPYLPLSAGSGFPLTGTLYGTSTNYSGSGDYAGSMTLGTGASTAEAHLTIGSGRTDSGFSYIDLVGDTTYPDFGFRIIRGNTGANASSGIYHRGTGNLDIQTTDSSSILLRTNNTTALTLSSSQNATFVGNVTTGPNISATGNTGNSTLTLQANTGNWVFTNVQASRNLEISDSDGTGVALTIDTSANATFQGDVEIRTGKKLILQRPNNGVATEISTDSTGAMVLNSINSEGFFFNNNGTNIFKLDPVNATFGGSVTCVGLTSQIVGGVAGYFGSSTSINANQIVHVRDDVATAAVNSAGGIKISSSPGNDVFLLKRNDGASSFFALQNSSASEFLTVNMSNGNAAFSGDVRINGSHLVLANGTTSAQGTDYLYIGGAGLSSSDAAIYMGNQGSGGGYGFRLYYSGVGSGNNNKFIIKAENAGTNVDALTFLSDGNATFASKAYGVTPVAADSGVMLATKAYVNQQISGGANYLGVWDPDNSLNSGYGNPSLAAAGRTDDSGDYFICSADGGAHPNGGVCEPDTWHVGDWVVWNSEIVDCAGTGTGTWQKIDNTSVLSGIGNGQTVALWEGASGVTDSEVLGNAPITVSGNNTTFAGDATLVGNLLGNTSNTTELGVYSTNAIKRIRMVQGGELHFGDTTVGAPLGITEGDWNNFGDQDRMSIYGRSSIKFYSGAVAASLSLTLDTNATFVGDVIVDSALLSNQENLDVDTAAAETIAQVAIATYTAAFFDFVVKKSTNVRSGTVYACHDGTNVQFTETSTQSIGDTSDVVLSVDISAGQMRLRATVASDNWSVKSLIRAI